MQKRNTRNPQDDGKTKQTKKLTTGRCVAGLEIYQTVLEYVLTLGVSTFHGELRMD